MSDSQFKIELNANQLDPNPYFGYYIEIREDYFIVLNPYMNEYQGRVYLYAILE